MEITSNFESLIIYLLLTEWLSDHLQLIDWPIHWMAWLIDWLSDHHTHWFYQTWTIWLTHIVNYIRPRFFTITVTIYKILKLFHTFNFFHMFGSLFIQGVTLQLDTWKIFSIFLHLENVFSDFSSSKDQLIYWEGGVWINWSTWLIVDRLNWLTIDWLIDWSPHSGNRLFTSTLNTLKLSTSSDLENTSNFDTLFIYLLFTDWLIDRLQLIDWTMVVETITPIASTKY